MDYLNEQFWTPRGISYIEDHTKQLNSKKAHESENDALKIPLQNTMEDDVK